MTFRNNFTARDDIILDMYYTLHGPDWSGWDKVLAHPHSPETIKHRAYTLGIPSQYDIKIARKVVAWYRRRKRWNRPARPRETGKEVNQ